MINGPPDLQHLLFLLTHKSLNFTEAPPPMVRPIYEHVKKRFIYYGSYYRSDTPAATTGNADAVPTTPSATATICSKTRKCFVSSFSLYLSFRKNTNKDAKRTPASYVKQTTQKLGLPISLINIEMPQKSGII